MVIGNGLVANAFRGYDSHPSVLIFASGVSNSKLNKESDFLREEHLLRDSIKKNQSKNLLYFSTCSILDPDLKGAAYQMHKLNMESIIKHQMPQYYIFRLSNLAGHTNNPYTILNYLYYHIANDISFEVWEKSERNLIDVEDVFKTVDYILKNRLFLNQVVNIANPKSYKTIEIVQTIEAYCGKQGIYSKTNRGAEFKIDVSPISDIYQSLQIPFGENYLQGLLKKYYPRNEL